MSAPTTVAHHTIDATGRPAEAGAACSCLGPTEAFPAELGALSMGQLQVLHSRVCRQLDREYLTGVDGPHPCTVDRLQEICGELDARDAA